MGAHLLQLEDAKQQKSAWDKRTPAVEFSIGDVVQLYDSNHDDNHKTVNKLAPHWSTPHIISGKSLNLYTLSNINGTAMPGIFASYRLRKFIPLRRSDLHAALPTSSPHKYDPLQSDLEDTEEHMLDSIASPFVEEDREPPDSSST